MSLRDKIKVTLSPCSTLEEMIDILQTATASDEVAEELFAQRVAHFWWESPKAYKIKQAADKSWHERYRQREQMRTTVPHDEIRKNAEAGDIVAMQVLGDILMEPFYNGIKFRAQREDENRNEYSNARDEFVQKSKLEGEKWLLKATKAGDADAQVAIARVFSAKVRDKHLKQEELKNDPDQKQALHWMRQAALQGDLDAQEDYKKWQEKALDVRDFIGDITIDNITTPVTFDYPDVKIKEDERSLEGLDPISCWAVREAEKRDPKYRVGGKEFTAYHFMMIIRKMLETFDSVYTDKNNNFWIVSTKYGIIADLEKQDNHFSVVSVSPLTGNTTKNLKKVANVKIYHRDL